MTTTRMHQTRALAASKFRLGRSTVSAVGEANDSKHPNLLRLRVLRSSLECILVALLLRWLPVFVRTFIGTILPGLFLPDRVVLKKLKPGWLDEFENEKAIYEELESLQGYVIPRFYGEARFEGTRALILSEVDGIMPWEQKLPPLGMDEFKERVEVAFRALNAFGLVYDDLKLDNMILLPDRVVLVDLESVGAPAEEDKEYCFNSDRTHLEVVYQRYLNNCYDDDF